MKIPSYKIRSLRFKLNWVHNCSGVVVGSIAKIFKTKRARIDVIAIKL